MPFDPSKPFTVVEEPKESGFDPSKPFTIIDAQGFDPGKPFKIVEEPQSPTERPAIPAPGETTPTVSRQVLPGPTQAFPVQGQAMADETTLPPRTGTAGLQTQDEALSAGVRQEPPEPEAEIQPIGKEGTVLRGASSAVAGILNRPEYLAAMMNPATMAAVGIRFAPPVAKQFFEDLGKASKGDNEALGRAAVIGIPALIGGVRAGKTLTERMAAQEALERAQSASSASHIDALARMEAQPGRPTVLPPMAGLPIRTEAAAERPSVLTPKARELTPTEAEDVFQLGKTTEESNQLLTRSSEELSKLPEERTPDASEISKTAEVHGDVRSLAGKSERKVPVKEGGEGVQPQAERGIPGEDDTASKETAANLPRDIKEVIQSEEKVQEKGQEVLTPSTAEPIGGKEVKPTAETIQEQVPLGAWRDVSQDPSLRTLSDDEFALHRKKVSKELNDLETKVDEGTFEPDTIEKRQQLGALQDKYASAELEAFRRNWKDRLSPEIFEKMLDLAGNIDTQKGIETIRGQEDFHQFSQLAEILSERRGEPIVDESFGSLLKGSADAREVYGWKFKKAKDLMEMIRSEKTAETPLTLPDEKAPVSTPSDPAKIFSDSIKDVPVKSKTVSDISEKATQDQNLGITALPKIGGTGLAKVGNAIKSAISEIRDIPKFTQFKQAVNRWFGTIQKTSLEVRALQKDIESRSPSELRREAITNWLQADGDVGLLDTWSRATRDKKRKLAYDAAKTLTPDELKIAQRIRVLYDDYLAKAQAYDLVGNGIEDYVTQVWKKPILGSAQFAQFAGKLSNTFRFGKKRVFENFFEGEQLGYKPVTKDISKLIGLYVSEMGKTIATKDFIKDLVSKDAEDGRPLAVPAGNASVVLDQNAQPNVFVRPNTTGKSTRDYSKWVHPALQDWKWLAKDPVSDANILMKGNLQLHPDIAGHVENVLSRSAIKRWYDKPSTALGVIPKAIVKGIDQWQGISKQVMLGFLSPFHHVQEATHAVGHRVNPLFDLPKLDHADPEIQRALNHGLALAGDNAAMSQFREGVGAHKIFKKIPIAGEWLNSWNDFLFNEYIPKLKLKTYNDILTRNKELYAPELRSGSVALDEVEYLSGQQANAAYGHLNYADIGRDPTIAHILRMTLLAPDFLEARGRFAAQAVKGLAGKAGREQLMAMATLAATFYVGSRILNKLGDDDYHWEEPFGVIHKGRLYTMRSVPEDIWRAFKDTRRFIYGRVSPIIGRGTIELLSGKNYRGEKTSAGETVKDLLVSWMPITLRNAPGLEKLSPSQANRSISAWESFLGAMGLQISRYSPISKTYGLAADWMKKEGVKEDRGTYPISKYQQLRYALEDADIEKASAELKRLSTEEKNNWGKLTSGFHSSLFHPWTKSSEMDRKFKTSLSGDDKLMFNEAEEQRKRIWQRFIEARSQAQKQPAP